MEFLVLTILMLDFVFSRNNQWPPNDPRWDDIPNWWDEENFNPPNGPEQEKNKNFWIHQGQEKLKEKLSQKINMNKAKNLVIFIGDGMGISTQTATRSFLGDDSTELSFEKFPFSGLSKTYCVNYKTGDSSCTATAILGGVKINYEVLNLDARVRLRNCSAQQDDRTHVDPLFFKYARDHKKSTGFVTTTRITHATVAAAYARSASRYWESNAPYGCQDIAHQMIHGDIGSNIDVILGGGRQHFFPNTTTIDGRAGSRIDGRNLLDEFRSVRQNFALVNSRDQLLSLNSNNVDKLLGIFAHSHMSFSSMRTANEPSLLEMTKNALEILQRNSNGFVLLVEGGRIDHGHHEGIAYRALSETAEFEKTVEFVRNQTNEDDTLIVVTADHSHVFTMGGYAPRHSNVLGVGDFSTVDSMWAFTLGYANGPGFSHHIDSTGRRVNPRGMQYMSPDFRQPSTVPMTEETHAAEDVGVYASGPQAHLFSGVYEQNYIANAIAYATCLGPQNFIKHPDCSDSSPTLSSSYSIVIFMSVFYLLFHWFHE